jgi:AbrB family looped-hinge helix DNA binding protein
MISHTQTVKEDIVLITIDKRGSINLPAALRKELGLKPGVYLNLTVENGGAIQLHPVSIFPSIRLNEQGIEKLKEARKSETGKLSGWILEDMKNARADTDKEIS